MAGPAPRRRFGPAPEVLAYFDGRALTPRFSWLDVWAEEHAHAFTVAKATELELLTAIRDSIRGALERGEGFETWRTRIGPELQRLGWWGPRRVADPDGADEDRIVDFSSPRRLRNLFWSNMNSARSAGQWDRIQRTKAALPYILYVRTTAADPRPEHLQWAGTILPADDPFWSAAFPPNGWGCKCTVRQITRRERDRLLASSSPIAYSAERPVIETRPFRNRRTGEITHVPVGIDPGWHSNPGLAASRHRAAAETLRDRAEAAAAEPTLRASARRIVAETVEGEGFLEHHSRAVARANDRRRMREEAIAAGRPPAEAEAEVNRSLPWSHAPMPVAVLPGRLAPHLPEGAPLVVTVTDNAIGHSHERHPTDPADWRHVQTALDRGEIHLSEAGDRLWAFVDVAGVTWVSVFRLLAGRWRSLTHFAPRSPNYRAGQRAQPGRRVVLEEE